MDPLNIPVAAVPQERFPEIIAILENLRDALESKDQTKLDAIGLKRSMIPQGVDLNIVIHNNLDQCCWQLSQFKKYSQPTRLADAVHDLEFVVRRLGTRRDVIPRYTLAAALARTPGREDEAARMFDAIMPALNRMEDGQVSAIWARAEWARFLRRRGEAEKAEKQEQWLRDWYQSHPYGMPPSKFAEAVLDDGEESNVILDGIPNFGKGVIEIPSMNGMFSGGMVMMHS